LVQEVLDVGFSATSRASLLRTATAPVSTEPADVYAVRVEPDHFQLDLRNEVVPIVIRNPEIFCPRGPACGVELIAALAARAARVIRAVVVIAIDSQPWNIGERSVNALPLMLKLVILLVLVQTSIVEVVATSEHEK